MEALEVSRGWPVVVLIGELIPKQSVASLGVHCTFSPRYKFILNLEDSDNETRKKKAAQPVSSNEEMHTG